MSFPKTRPSLIQRIAADGRDDDWRVFVCDYWGPIFRFISGRGALCSTDVEDVTAVTFEVVAGNRLLERWIDAPAAKLRTLLCSVARKVEANFVRGRIRRDQRLKALAEESTDQAVTEESRPDSLEAAWAEDLLQRAVERILYKYHRENKGDYIRVLYGRICEGSSLPVIAKSLNIKLTEAENYYKHARRQLGEHLKELVREHVARYSRPEEEEAEFEAEWQSLGDCLTSSGGLEAVVRQAYERTDPEQQGRLLTAALRRLRRDRSEAPREVDEAADE